MKKDESKKVIARNKNASYSYFIEETLECGIALTGTEIKSIRNGKCSINEAYVSVKTGQMLLINMNIAKYEQGNIFNHKERRDRVLLAHKDEIKKMIGKTSREGYTIIPLEVYLLKGRCKVLIALAKGKSNSDKREVLKEKDAQMEIKSALAKKIKYQNE